MSVNSALACSLKSSLESKTKPTEPMEVLYENRCSKNFEKFTGKHLCQSFFLMNFIKKETMTNVFSCQLCEIFNNTLFTEHLRAPASEPKTWN